MDRAQRVDEKNGITCLFIILIPRVMVIKMSKMADFVFFADICRFLYDSKKLVTV